MASLDVPLGIEVSLSSVLPQSVYLGNMVDMFPVIGTCHDHVVAARFKIESEQDARSTVKLMPTLCHITSLRPVHQQT